MKLRVQLAVPEKYAKGLDMDAVRKVFPYGKMLPIEVRALTVWCLVSLWTCLCCFGQQCRHARTHTHTHTHTHRVLCLIPVPAHTSMYIVFYSSFLSLRV
jgi:hypothetical protein